MQGSIKQSITCLLLALSLGWVLPSCGGGKQELPPEIAIGEYTGSYQATVSLDGNSSQWNLSPLIDIDSLNGKLYFWRKDSNGNRLAETQAEVYASKDDSVHFEAFYYQGPYCTQIHAGSKKAIYRESAREISGTFSTIDCWLNNQGNFEEINVDGTFSIFRQ